MQQLLSLNGQSDVFTRGASELTVTSDGTESVSNSSDFARALLTGMKQNKAVVATDTAAQAGANVATSTIAEASGKAPATTQSKPLDLDHERVGEPVEAPILEMLEEMQNLLQPANDTDAVASSNHDVDADQLAKLTQLLEKLGTEHLSDEQRQQLAGEILAGLSTEEKQLVSEFDTDALTHLAVKGKNTVDADEISKMQTDVSEEPTQLLLKIAKIADLADQAVAATHINTAEVTPAAMRGNEPQVDVEALEWLAKQLNSLAPRQTQKSATDASKEFGAAALMQQLQRQIADTDSLSTEQKQQLRQWLADQQATLQQDLTRTSLLAAIMKDSVKYTPDLATSQPTPEKTSIPLDRRGEVRAAELTETRRQTVPNPATAERINAQGQLAGEAQSTSRTVSVDATELKLPLNSADELNVTDKKADVTQLATALEHATTLKPATALDTANGPDETTLSPSVSQVSTTSGAVKATELSSTLQSTLQAIQKPFDPSQAEASQKLQERINIMLSKNIQRADIRLDPPELGQLHVRVNMNSDQASVQFQVQSPQARDAVETALPRLREMLEQQGVALADTDVREQQQQLAGNNEWSESDNQSGHDQSGEFVEEHEISLSNGRPIAPGAVDFYV